MRKEEGYTLIEVIVALAIFAIVSTMTAGVMLQAFETKKRLAAQTDVFNELHVIVTLMRRDIAQITNRAIRGSEGRLYPPFIGESNYTEFTRSGYVNPNGVLQSSGLKRVAYLCGHGQLTRRSWAAVDSPSRKDITDQVMLEHLKHCSLAYFSKSHEHMPSWRPYAASQEQKSTFIPAAIELSIELERYGAATFLFPIPEGMYGE
jgi:general secretion pathway protein J